MSTIIGNTVAFGYDSLDEAFPALDLNFEPFGSRVLVQIRAPKKKTKGGIILTEEAQETEAWNTQVAKVVAVGPVAFKNRTTLVPWPEGDWVQVGDFVRCPKYGGDKWTAPTEEGQEVTFITFNDLDLSGKVSDPLKVRAFI